MWLGSANSDWLVVKVSKFRVTYFLEAIVQPLQSETVVRHLKHAHYLSLNMENHLHHQSLREGINVAGVSKD